MTCINFIEMTMFKALFIQQISHKNYISELHFRMVINPSNDCNW